MKAFVSIVLAASVFFSGLASQLDYLIHPERYHAQELTVADLPVPVETPAKDAFVQLADVNMHYLVYGSGKQPLILIHGNGGSANSLKEAATYLANDYTVYVPESRCHGQSSDPGEISYQLMAKDFKEFAEALHIERPVIIGHSDGAINALTLAAEYPTLPKAVIACGANSNPAAFKPYFPLGVKINNALDKDKLNDLMLTEPDFTAAYLAQITCPTYVVSGQFDIMWNSDTVFIAESIPGSEMTILKGEGHSSYMSKNGQKTYMLASAWLKSIENA